MGKKPAHHVIDLISFLDESKKDRKSIAQIKNQIPQKMTKRKKMRDNHFIDWRKNVCDSFSKLDGKRDMRERAGKKRISARLRWNIDVTLPKWLYIMENFVMRFPYFVYYLIAALWRLFFSRSVWPGLLAWIP